MAGQAHPIEVGLLGCRGSEVPSVDSSICLPECMRFIKRRKMVHEPFENSFEPLYKIALVFLINVNELEQVGIQTTVSLGAAEVRLAR